MREFFKKIDEINTWDSLNIEIIKNKKFDLISKLENMLNLNDLNSCKRSTSLAVYPDIYHNNKQYLKCKITLDDKRLIAQTRCFNNYTCRIILGVNRAIFNDWEYCNVCNEKNSLFHKLMHCVKFNDMRAILTPELIKNEFASKALLDLLCSESNDEIKRTVKFIEFVVRDKISDVYNS